MNAIRYAPHLRNDDTRDWRLTLDDILCRRALVAHFQPIWRARDLTCYGWEALIRGPQDSPLARPDALFSAARAAQRIAELDYACREAAIAAYAHQIANGAPHKLFLNVEPLAFIQGAQKGWTRHLLTAHGMAPSQVVIEITEASPHLDYDTLRQAVTHYRRQGFEIAIDDLGEGYASLRVWSEIRPDYVKLDRHFVHQAVTDGAVRRFLEAVVMLSQTTGSRIVAEGVEKAAEWHLVQQLGFDFVQGFLFAPPQKTLVDSLPTEKRRQWLQTGNAQVLTKAHTRNVASLALAIPPATLETNNETIYARFTADPDLSAIPVVDTDERPLGLIFRPPFLEDFARPYRHELFGRKSCQHYLSKAFAIRSDATIHELSQQLQTLALTELGRPFLVVGESGKYLGLGDGQALLRTLVELQLEAARYANPLTGLPGNLPINDRIQSLLTQQLPFVVAYVDIAHFKAYNDLYGFERGDELIRLVAELLKRHVTHPEDFIGHIGGDDFIVLFRDPAWQERITALFSAYTAALPSFYSSDDWQRGGIEAEDRRGNVVFHPLSSLTVGALPVLPQQFDSYRAVAAAAAEVKKLAKKLSADQTKRGIVPANALFTERRQPPAPSAPL